MAELIESLRKILNKVVVKYFDYTHYKLKIEKFFNKSINFTHELFTATLIPINHENKEFLCKVSALDEDIRSEFPADIQDIELNVNSNLMMDYKLLQNEYKVFGKDRLATIRFYESRRIYHHEILVFENIYEQGFRPFNRFQCISWEYARVAITELAKLHALSFSLNFEQPREYERYLNIFRHSKLKNIKDTEARRKFWRNIVIAAVKVTREENKLKLKNYLYENLIFGLSNFFEPLREPVLGHGDFRLGNMLHRKTTNGIEIVIVNYQTVREISPVVDLIYLLATATDAQFRRDCCEKLRSYYYKQLCSSMRRLQVDPETTYTKEDFDFEWGKKLPYALCVAAFFLPLITMNKDNIPKTYNDLTNCHISNKSEIFATRMNEMVDDFIRWGLL